MFERVVDDFEYTKELIFEYLVLSKDLASWLPSSVDFYRVKNNFSEGRLETVEVYCDIGSQRATIMLEVTHYEPFEEVRYYSHDAVYDNGEPVRQGYLFPFHHMAYRTVFRDSPAGCQVLQEMYIKSRGPIGWLICKFVILPKTKKDIKNSILSLKKYLSYVT